MRPNYCSLGIFYCPNAFKKRDCLHLHFNVNSLVGDCVPLVNQHTWECDCGVITVIKENPRFFSRMVLVSSKRSVKALVSASPTFCQLQKERKEQREKKDDGTICTIGGSDREGERQGKGETSTCLMAIGDITYTNNEAEDDNIFCMMSVFVKAVLTQRDGTLNHPHAPDVRIAGTYTHAHAREDFTSHFPARCHVKYAIAGGEEETRGHFVREVYASFVSQYTHTLSAVRMGRTDIEQKWLKGSLLFYVLSHLFSPFLSLMTKCYNGH